MKISYLVLSVLLVGAAPPASLDLIQQGAADMGAVIKTPLTVGIDAQARFMGFKGDRLNIAPQTAALVKSREEARALVALALAYQMSEPASGSRKPGVAEYAVALPLFLAAQSSADRRQYATRSGYPVEWSEPVGNDPTDIREARKAARQSRSNLTLHLLQRAGGCSGPLVDLLNRMRAEDHGSGAGSPVTNAGFAKIALTDLGRNVYPPDRSCE
jgi:hypothetical protein